MFTTLRSKILAGFAAVIAINVAFSLWAIVQFSDVGEQATEAIAANYELTVNVAQLGAVIEDQLTMLDGLVHSVAPDPTIVKFEARTTDFRFVLARVAGNNGIADRRAVIDTIRGEYERFLATAAEYRNIVVGRQRGDAREMLFRTVFPAAAGVRQRCYSLLFQNQEQIHDIRQQLRGELRQSLYVVAIATVVSTLLGIVGAGFYANWAIRPIQRLTQAVKNLTGGRLGEQILITTADELGDLSFEFNRMIERLGMYEAMNIEQLLLEKRKVETIVQSIGTPIIVVDAGMRLLLINNAAMTLFRLLPQKNYEGRPLAEALDDVGVVKALEQALHAGPALDAGSPYVYLVREEGAERYYSVSALPLETSSAVSGAVAVFTDITHFKELDRLKSDFLAKVSHEFRTPLSSIIMSIDILREAIVGPINESQLDLLNSSKEDCLRLWKLITDLLELSRIEARTRHRAIVAIELPALVDSVLRPHRLPAREKGVALVEKIAPGVPAIWGELEELRWLFNNLVSNALRHTEAGGTITVSAAVEAGWLVVSVEDTGHGIPLDSLHRIFDKFHQVSAPAMPSPGSVGLGLAIARDVVEGYGGRISVTSELHKGSCFTVRIPLEHLAAPNGA